MSEIKVNSIKGVGASVAALSINNTDGTCTANITNNLSNRRLTINGDMRVAQRGTSTTTSGDYPVDRFKVGYGNTDEAPTFEQADVASGTTPYTLGFRKSLKVTNGNQTSGAGAAVHVKTFYKIEAQDIANSGWNYTSTSSYITLSFWVKSSVAQNFYGRVVSKDGTSQNYPFETGSLSADTWTKITKTIPGNSNLTFNNDNGEGLELEWLPFRGTDTTGSVSLDTWAAYASGTRTPDNTSTWYTTNDATFELTGVQLEVSDHATDFEHRTFGQELTLCQRYCCVLNSPTGLFLYNDIYSNDTITVSASLPVTMRTTPSITQTGSGGTSSTGFTYSNLAATPTLAASNSQNIIVYRGVASTGRTYIYLAPGGELTMEAEL